MPKEKIAADGDYNLNGERYREGSERQTTFHKFPLGEILKLGFGTRITKKDDEGTLFPVYGGGGESFRTDSFTRENDIVISRFAMSPECVRTVSGKFYLLDSGFTFSIAEIFSERASKEFVAQVLLNSQDRIYACARGHAQKNIDVDAFKAIQIPLPPLEVQREIVAEIEGYQKVINGARAVLDNYRPHIPIRPDWPMVLVSDVVKLSSGEFLSSSMMKGGDYPVYGGNGINGTHNEYLFESPTVVIGRVGAYCGAVHLTQPKAWVTDNALYVKELLKPVDLKFLEQALRSLDLNLYAKVGGQPSISQSTVLERKIALPDLDKQRAIVAEIEAEKALVAANRELITRFEQKIQSTLARIWGEESPSIT